MTCKTKKKKQQKKGCPYKRKTFKSATTKSKLDLLKPFKKKKLPVDRVTITITATGFVGKASATRHGRASCPEVEAQRLTPPVGWSLRLTRSPASCTETAIAAPRRRSPVLGLAPPGYVRHHMRRLGRPTVLVTLSLLILALASLRRGRGVGHDLLRRLLGRTLFSPKLDGPAAQTGQQHRSASTSPVGRRTPAGRVQARLYVDGHRPVPHRTGWRWTAAGSTPPTPAAASPPDGTGGPDHGPRHADLGRIDPRPQDPRAAPVRLSALDGTAPVSELLGPRAVGRPGGSRRGRCRASTRPTRSSSRRRRRCRTTGTWRTAQLGHDAIASGRDHAAERRHPGGLMFAKAPTAIGSPRHVQPRPRATAAGRPPRNGSFIARRRARVRRDRLAVGGTYPRERRAPVRRQRRRRR